jgi:plastocyanin
MTRRYHTGVVAGALALAAVAPAFAQGATMTEPYVWNYTGVLTPYAYFPPRIPSTWIIPNYVVDYRPPRVVYLPVPAPVAPEQPAVEPVQVTTILLHSHTSPADLRVKPGTVVTWTNGDNEEHMLVVARPSVSGAAATDASERWQLRANGSVSLDFHQPGTYEYYRFDEPDQRAHLVVSE